MTIVWDVDSDRGVCFLRTAEAAFGIVFSPDGNLLAVSLRDGTTALWDISAEE
jgi:WD40 repeat protein